MQINKINMIYGRKFYYILLIIWYYTFVILFAWGVSFLEVLAPVVLMTIISYYWVIRSVAQKQEILGIDYRDLIFNISIYAFVNFVVAFAAGLSYAVTSFEGYFLLVSPVTVWGIIWIDMYSQKLKSVGL